MPPSPLALLPAPQKKLSPDERQVLVQRGQELKAMLAELEAQLNQVTNRGR